MVDHSSSICSHKVFKSELHTKTKQTAEQVYLDKGICILPFSSVIAQQHHTYAQFMQYVGPYVEVKFCSRGHIELLMHATSDRISILLFCNDVRWDTKEKSTFGTVDVLMKNKQQDIIYFYDEPVINAIQTMSIAQLVDILDFLKKI